MSPKNTNLEKDVEILLPLKFRWIPFNSSWGEVENVSDNQRPGPPSCFSDRPEKHKLCGGHWDLASCQVSLNSVPRFPRSLKSLSQSEARAAILLFQSYLPKRLLRSCFMSSFVEFGSAFSAEKLKMSQPIWGRGSHLVFPISPKNTNLTEDIEILLPVKFRWTLFSGFRGEVEKCLSQSEDRAAILFYDLPKNTNLVEDVHILLPVNNCFVEFRSAV